MPVLHIECPECSGTGLYVGFMERKGEAVICVRCSGTGRQSLSYKEYTGRKNRSGITKVRSGSGGLIDNPKGSQWFSYQEFQEKIKTPKA